MRIDECDEEQDNGIKDESQSLFFSSCAKFASMEPPSHHDLTRFPVAGDGKEIRTRFDGRVKSVIDAINDGAPLGRTSIKKLKIKKDTNFLQKVV